MVIRIWRRLTGPMRLNVDKGRTFLRAEVKLKLAGAFLMITVRERGVAGVVVLPAD
jgi:hypothetical protein